MGFTHFEQPATFRHQREQHGRMDRVAACPDGASKDVILMNPRVRRFLAVSSFFCALAVLVAVAAPAVAVTGVEKVRSSSAKDSTSPKIQIARCSPGNRVVGGGGVVHTLSDTSQGPEEDDTKVIERGDWAALPDAARQARA
jgi:hypothetical protein